MGSYKYQSWYSDTGLFMVKAHTIIHHALLCVSHRMGLEKVGMLLEI